MKDETYVRELLAFLRSRDALERDPGTGAG
jgi:hypothetical protein